MSDDNTTGPYKCPKCDGTNISLREAYLGDQFMYRILECYDCRDKELERAIAEMKPETRTQYAKAKFRTDYYGTVTIKDDDDGRE